MLQEKLKNANIKYFPQHLLYSPEWLVLGVNNICNLHCKMCDVGVSYTQSNFYENLMGSKPINMPLELIKKIIDQATQYFPQVKLGYAFTEPLIYPHLIESLEYAQQNNLYTTVTTNALTLEKKAQNLVESGLNELYVSIDGLEATHNKIRGHKSSFQRAIAGIETLQLFQKAPKVGIICAITEWNYHQLKDLADFFRPLGIASLAFMHTQYTDAGVAEVHNIAWGHQYPATRSNTNELNFDNLDLTILLDQIRQIRQQTYSFKVYFSPEIDNPTDLEVYYQQPEKLIGKRCNDVFKNMMIKSDGSVIPAHGRCYNLTIGNLYEQSLKEIWNGKVIQDFRKDLLKAGGLLPACSRCCSAF